MARIEGEKRPQESCKWFGDKVIVTTDYRGVFFGTLRYAKDDIVRLENARNCVYWSAETRGFLGLAAYGPAEGSKIGAVAPELELRKVTSISLCSEDAIDRWESFL